METTSSKTKILISGMGGGLDIVNASLLYFHAKKESKEVILGSTRPYLLQEFKNISSFSDCGGLVNAETIFLTTKKKTRFCENKVAELLKEEVTLFSTHFGGVEDRKRMSIAIQEAVKKFNLSAIIFVDGGGDSLILKPSDASNGSESSDPFAGGDSCTLTAIHSGNLPIKVYHAIISVGLDINDSGFQENVEMLKKRKAYFGRVNLKTGENDSYQLGHILKLDTDALSDWFEFAQKLLVLTAEDTKTNNKTMSHTATVTYHALKGNYGVQRTFVPWEPITDGKKGVLVKPDHCWMYFFDAYAVEELKIDLAQKKQSVIFACLTSIILFTQLAIS